MIMQVFKEKNMCTGCSACVNVCPVKCITMEPDRYGFLYPKVNEALCVKCGRCRKHCHTFAAQRDFSQSKLYSFISSDEENLLLSSSGGAFGTIAKRIIDNGGYVCAAVFDKDWKVRHIISNEVEQIKCMQGAKYVQSDLGYVFTEIRTLLDDGKKLLFVGTPCQVLGLKTFLQRDYAGLFLIDVICHSVPSPMIFSEYIKLLEKKCGKLSNFEFRNKKNGWKNYSIHVVGAVDEKYWSHKGDWYMEGFLDGLYHRSCCDICPVKTRLGYQSDLTLGDFWGYDVLYPDTDIFNGVSAVIVNTSKGYDMLDVEYENAESLELFSKVNTKYYTCSKRAEGAELFWKYFSSCGLSSAFRKLYRKPFIIKLKTFVKDMITIKR